MPLLKEKKKKSNKEMDLSGLSLYDKVVKKIYTVLDNGYNDRIAIKTKNQNFRSILNRELDISKGYSQGSIVDFVNSVNITKENRLKQKTTSGLSPNSNDLFTKNINDIFGYFQDMYRNKFIEITDLKFIAKFIPALGEAVKTVLDAIVSSDNIAETINREIKLADGISPEDRIAIINEIERMEKELKLKRKLKTTVYKKALVTGTHYVYAVSYNRIFKEYDAIKKNQNSKLKVMPQAQFGNKSESKSASESYYLGDVDITPAMENVQIILESSTTLSGPKSKLDSKTIKNKMTEVYQSLPIISCDQCSIEEEAMESMITLIETPGAMEAYMNGVEKKRNKIKKSGELTITFPDAGTKGTDQVKNQKASNFDIPGTYIKYIDAKNLIPLRIFDQTIGYYLIHPKDKKRSSREVEGITSIGNTLFSSVNIGETKKHDAVQRIVDTISEGILLNFDKKFVTKNAEYKKMIGDVIVANGLTDKDYNIQFIPADDIIPFTIQEDENGFGESILSDSLFPAKLLLSMIVTRMLNYINKTGNKTIAHIHRGMINAFDTNQLNRVVRDLQDQDITFNDLLSPNLVFNKFNRDGNMAIPTTRDGKRLIEFEIQEGQQIDMNPEYEKELENMAILGTGVPSVIMEYVGSADFAKQLVSANIKFAGRVSSLQADLEEPTTLLYKKLCENSNLTDAQKTICRQSLEIKLPRPRVLTNSNNSEYVSNIIQTAEAIAETIYGRETLTDTENNPHGVKYKERLMLKIVKDGSPFLEWDKIEKMAEEVVIEVEEEAIENEGIPKDNDSSGSNGF